MKTRYLMGVAGAAGAIVAVGQLTGATADTNDRSAQTEFASSGVVIEAQGGTPDVIVFDIRQTANWESGSMRAYSVGTTSCNIGEVPLDWYANTNDHPVIGQNMFRLAPGQNGHARFEHLGQAWLKHGFCALSQPSCGDCQPTNCNTLGIGCSDPYTANRNGTQSSAGPKYQINATNGFYPYPPANPAYSGSVARRLQVPKSEVEAASNPGARYYFEAQYVCPDENVEVDLLRAANNVSWREASLASDGTHTGYPNVTQVEQAGIYAWKDADPSVLISWRAIAGVGNAYIASQAYDNGDGTWDYEYAVHNLDMDRSIMSVTVPVDGSVTVSAQGFRSVAYHSGELWSNEAWSGIRNTGDVNWAMPNPGDTNGNALRWGTMYNYRFTADSAPTETDMYLEFFKSGDQGPGFNATVKAPISLDLCLGDFDESGDVGFGDLTSLLAEWGFCFNCPQDFNGDFNVAFDDLVQLLSLWGPCE